MAGQARRSGQTRRYRRRGRDAERRDRDRNLRGRPDRARFWSICTPRCRSALRWREFEPNSKERLALSQPLRRRQRRPSRSRRRLWCGHPLRRHRHRPSRQAPRRARGYRPPHGGSPKSAASISRRSPAAALRGRSPMPMSSAVSARPSLRRKRSERCGLISTRCERPSPPRWRDRSEKSRTIISSIRSTSRPASNG